jgi:hypothetical protein
MAISTAMIARLAEMATRDPAAPELAGPIVTIAPTMSDRPPKRRCQVSCGRSLADSPYQGQPRVNGIAAIGPWMAPPSRITQ